MDFKYSMFLQWSNEDRGYIVTIPEFPGLSAFGKTSEEAVAQVQTAAALFLEDYQDSGTPIPEPNVLR